MRYAAIARAADGAVLLLAPAAVCRVAGGPADRASTVVARALGVRQIVQAVTIGRSDRRGWALVGAAVDAAHAASMVGLAAVSRDHRRLAACDAAVAAGWAASGLRRAWGV